MPRFFCSKEAITGSTLTLTDAFDVKHIRTVLRLKAGDEITVCDEKGTEYRCSVLAAGAHSVTAAIKNTSPLPAGSSVSLVVACALAKNARMDDIVDKLTQLGAARIIPIMTERVIVRWDPKACQKHHARWQTIAVAAAKQSGRRQIPVVDPVTGFSDVLKRARDYDALFIPTLEGERTGLKSALAAKAPRTLLVLIGPEGDFTPDETAAARAAGAQPLSLGANVLRVDTAAIAAASVILIE